MTLGLGIGLVVGGLVGYWLGRCAEAEAWREARGRKVSGGKEYVVYQNRR